MGVVSNVTSMNGIRRFLCNLQKNEETLVSNHVNTINIVANTNGCMMKELFLVGCL